MYTSRPLSTFTLCHFMMAIDFMSAIIFTLSLFHFTLCHFRVVCQLYSRTVGIFILCQVHLMSDELFILCL